MNNFFPNEKLIDFKKKKFALTSNTSDDDKHTRQYFVRFIIA